MRKMLLSLVMVVLLFSPLSAEVFDAMDAVAGWENYMQEGVSLKLTTVPGAAGNALAAEYDMGSGAWFGIWKQMNVDVSKFSGIKIVYRGEGSANSIELKIEDADGSNFGKVLAGKSNATEWTTVEVKLSDLTYLWGGDQNLNLNSPKLHIAVSIKDGDQGGAGKIIIDNIELVGDAAPAADALAPVSKPAVLSGQGVCPFCGATLDLAALQPAETKKEINAAAPIAPAAPVATGDILDAVDGPAGWENYTDNGVTVNLSAVDGQAGKALQVDYNMNSGGWLGIWKQQNADLTSAAGIKIIYRGEGAANSIELKLEDADGTNFGYVLKTKSDAADWTTAEIKFSDLTYFWGGDQSLNRVNPKLHLAISKKDGDAGGAGKVFIDRIELIK